MTDLKKDDKVRIINEVGYPGIWTVKAVDGDEAWCLNPQGSGHLTFRVTSVKKLPDFFEVGKTYQGTISSNTTFDCHYIGWVGSTLTGKKYAAGQVNYQNGEIYPISTARFKDWTEV